MHEPTGIIQSDVPGGLNGLTWEAITKYDDFIHAAADPVGWPIERVRGTIIIESRGNARAMQANASNGNSYGLMQIVPYGVGWDGWNALVKEKAGLRKNAPSTDVINALYDPAINIAVGVAILEQFYVTHGTLDKASSSFFTGRPDWGGADTVNGTTGQTYRNALNALIAEQKAFQPIDLVSFIVGGVPTDDSYGFKSPTSLPYYEYFEGHGGHANQHTGIDATTTLGQRLFSPINGTVVCSGTGNGSGAWGTGCAAFPDKMGRGAGRVEILADDGKHSLILGHCSRSLVSRGQAVSVGDAVAEAGGMNGWHVHIEAREWNGSDYVILDPRKVFSVGKPSPVQPSYPDRLPVPQPEEFDNSVRVIVTRENVPVLQGAYMDAPHVGLPLKKGDDFLATMQMIGVDKKFYWVTTRRGRVPVEGTEAPDWQALPCPDGEGGISQETLDVLVDTVEVIRSKAADVEGSLRHVITAIGSLEGE